VSGLPSSSWSATLDTKGNEYTYLRDRIREHGVDVLLIDAGILGEPLIEPDVTRQAVAMAAGADVQALADARNRARAIETMSRGAAEIVLRLHADGRLAAAGALGGTGGTAIATHAMRQLPVGMPKLMVSTVASGDTSSYVGWTDITMMGRMRPKSAPSATRLRPPSRNAVANGTVLVRAPSRLFAGVLPAQPAIAGCFASNASRVEAAGIEPASS
jgi:uncharacterized protein (UPF0261 family)